MVIYRSREYSYQNPVAAMSLGLCVVLTAGLLGVSGAWTAVPVLGVVIVVLLALLLVIPLTVTVDDDSESVTSSDAVIRVSLAGLLRRSIPLADVTRVERRDYRPIREFGGWGWRQAFKHRADAYATRGTSAVVLTLRDGSHVYLGVADEDGLIQSLQTRIFN